MKMNSKLSAQITGNGIFGVLYNSCKRMPSDLPQLAPSALVYLAPLPDLQFLRLCQKGLRHTAIHCSTLV